VGGRTNLAVGTVVLRGSFVQNGAGNSLAVAGTKFVFDGGATQTVSFSDWNNSYFRSVDITLTASVSINTHTRMVGNLDLDGALTVLGGRTLWVNGTIFHAGVLTNNGTIVNSSCVSEGGTFSGTGNNPCP